MGLVQDRIVRHLVGLNGAKEDTSHVSLLIDEKWDRVLHCLESDQLQYSLEISERQRIGQHAYLFKTDRRKHTQRYLVICPDVDEKKTQLVMVSFELRYYGIEKTLGVLDDESMRFAHLIGALRKCGLSIPADEMIETNKEADLLPASGIAYDQALRVTESKLLTLRSFPPHQKAILVGIALLFGITTALWLESILSPDLYGTFLVFAVLSILFDFLPLVRVRRFRRFDK